MHQESLRPKLGAFTPAPQLTTLEEAWSLFLWCRWVNFFFKIPFWSDLLVLNIYIGILIVFMPSLIYSSFNVSFLIFSFFLFLFAPSFNFLHSFPLFFFFIHLLNFPFLWFLLLFNSLIESCFILLLVLISPIYLLFLFLPFFLHFLKKYFSYS